MRETNDCKLCICIVSQTLSIELKLSTIGFFLEDVLPKLKVCKASRKPKERKAYLNV